MPLGLKHCQLISEMCSLKPVNLIPVCLQHSKNVSQF